MEYEDDYSYSEDNQYSNYDNYSIYSNDFQVEHQANFCFSEEQIDSFDKLLQLHFSQYTPEEISTYIRSMETITLITLIRNSTDPHLIKSSITFLQTELDQFFHSRKRGINTSHITNTENLKFINYTKSVPQQSGAIFPHRALKPLSRYAVSIKHAKPYCKRRFLRIFPLRFNTCSVKGRYRLLQTIIDDYPYRSRIRFTPNRRAYQLKCLRNLRIFSRRNFPRKN